MDRTPVESSNVRSIGYDESSQTLEAEFLSGAVYQYLGVPLETHRSVMAAPSIGRAFATLVKAAGYRYRKVG